MNDMVDAMRHQVTGVGFLAHHISLPSMTFVSADAVQWLIKHVEGVTNQQSAEQILEVGELSFTTVLEGDFITHFMVT